jgi:hypothetical protein
MTTSKSFGCAMLVAALVGVAWSETAHADTEYHVWIYENASDGSVPDPSSYPISEFEFALRQSMRQWEAASGNRIRFVYRGRTASWWFPYAGQIIIEWGSLGPGRVAKAWLAQPAIPGGYVFTMNNNPLEWTVGSQLGFDHVQENLGTLSALGVVADLESTIMHELGHIVQHATADPAAHATDSVRGITPTSPATDLSQRWPWNRDMVEVPWLIHYDSQEGGYQLARINPTTLATTPASIVYEPRIRFPTAALSDPGTRVPGAELLVAFASEDWIMTPPDLANMAINLRWHHLDGTITGHSLPGTGGWATRLPLCIASDGALQMTLVFASVDEAPATTCGSALCVGAGKRAVMISESSDGGATWTTPTAMSPTATTRTGVSCTYDASAGRFIAAYSDGDDEALRIWSRGRVKPGWSSHTFGPAPTRTRNPNVGGVPYVSAHSGRASVAWFDNIEGPVAASIYFDIFSKRYRWTTDALRWILAVGDLRLDSRAIAIPSDNPGELFASYSLVTTSPSYSLEVTRMRALDRDRLETAYTPWPDFQPAGMIRSAVSGQFYRLSTLRR